MKQSKKSVTGQLIEELTILRRIVELSPEGVLIQREGKCVFANPAAARLFGAGSPDELIGREIVDVASPSRTTNVLDLVHELLGENEAPRIQKKFVRLDGTMFDVEVAATPITYQNKPAIQMVAHDITRRKKAEEELRESEERFRKLVDNAPLGFAVFDTDGNIITVNKSMLKIMQLESTEAALGINVFDYSPMFESGLAESVQMCLETEDTVFAEHFYQSENGLSAWLRVYLVPLRRSGFRSIYVQALVEDFTESKIAQEELLKKNRRIENELNLANTIQSSLFPVNLPQVEGATLAATAVSAREVGGDYCDLFITKDKRLGIAIGDVMGKGVPAALFVAMTYAIVRNHAFDVKTPSELVNRLNRTLYPQLELTEQFITFFYAIYDPETQELNYTNAGHNPPVIFCKETGEYEYLKVRDFFLGGSQEASYCEGNARLYPGDIILFYTDGLKEGMNANKEQFGMERIINILKENSIYDPASIQEIISCEFYDFLQGVPPYDDVTMIIIKIDE